MAEKSDGSPGSKSSEKFDYKLSEEDSALLAKIKESGIDLRSVIPQKGLSPSSALLAPIPRFELPSLSEVEPSPLVTNVEQNLASEFYKKLIKWIEAFDAELDSDHEIGIRLVSFGQTFALHLKTVGYWDPSLIRFGGETETGDPVDLIQHVSQISVLLMKLPRLNPTEPKAPIGFRGPETESTND